MSKVKLDLQRKDYAMLRTFAQGHRDAMAGNANYATPEPTVAVFDPSLLAFSATIAALTSGMKYAFRIRGLGPNDLESPWSDEVICMAP